MHIQMIGHSTVTLEHNGKRIMTDPYFGELGNLMYQRKQKPYKTRENWAKEVYMVLVSHNHWDHMDRKFFRALPHSVPVLMPENMVGFSKIYGIKNGVGMEDYQSVEYGDFTITCVPAKHTGSACGYMIQTMDHTAYFSGDTFYSDFMNDLGKNYSIDTAFIPVTTFKIPMTMDPSSAVEAVGALKPKVVVPIHLGIEPRAAFMRTEDSPEHFVQQLNEKGLNTKVVLLNEGEMYPY